MRIEQLQQLLAIVSAGSMHKAARELYMSQPNLSTSVRNMERELGRDLFERSGRGLVLTNFGREFVEHARVVCAQFEVLSHINSPDCGQAGSFRVVSQFFRFPQTIFGNLCTRHQGERITFCFQDCSLMNILEKLSQNEADIGILIESHLQRPLMQELYRAHRLSFHKLYDQALSVIVGRGSPLYSREQASVSVEELFHYPFILFSDMQYNFAAEWDYLGMRKHSKQILVGDQLSLFQMLDYTDAFAMSLHNPALYKHAPFMDGVRNLSIEGHTLMMSVGYIVSEDRPVSDITGEYIAMLRELLR